MSIIKKFQEVTKVLNELSTAAVSARSEVQKLLTVLEGPAPTMTTVSDKINKTDSFCNSTGTTCVDTTTGFGTVGVSDNYGSGGNLTYAWNTCADEYHWSGTAATDPCSS
jgi:hypothetical protein